jgi:hypothetical protein
MVLSALARRSALSLAKAFSIDGAVHELGVDECTE